MFKNLSSTGLAKAFFRPKIRFKQSCHEFEDMASVRSAKSGTQPARYVVASQSAEKQVFTPPEFPLCDSL
jgi:hypothetical protein